MAHHSSILIPRSRSHPPSLINYYPRSRSHHYISSSFWQPRSQPPNNPAQRTHQSHHPWIIILIPRSAATTHRLLIIIQRSAHESLIIISFDPAQRTKTLNSLSSLCRRSLKYLYKNLRFHQLAWNLRFRNGPHFFNIWTFLFLHQTLTHKNLMSK